MRMFNLDGSEGKMCGNAIRCVGKYLYDNAMVQKTVHLDDVTGQDAALPQDTLLQLLHDHHFLS